MICRRAVLSDVPAITALWETAFGDSEADIARFLSVYPSEEYALVLEENDTVASMLFLLPTVWRDGARVCSVGYIYAGATASAARGRGCYKKLLDYAAAHARANGMAALVLRPATAALEESYRRLGFTVPLTCDEKMLPLPLGQPLDANAYVRRRRELLRKAGMPFADWDARTVAYAMDWCRAVSTENGILLYSEEDGRVTVWEWLADGPLPAASEDGVRVRTVGCETVIGLLMPLCEGFHGGYLGYGLE